ncbi:hypothetical protein [Desulfobacula sp.]|uniref:hypothetical protein n=1 Tax=Desulfobacula sp. TaxID=2593537 RepID=UPI00261D4877|nr:hypothetical protein [Desulfobacula sp.]
MNGVKDLYIILLTGMMFFFTGNAVAKDLVSRHATITYSHKDDLRAFNNELYMGRLRSRIQTNRGDTLEDEVITKINFIVEKVMTALDMSLPQLTFSIMIHPDERAVHQDFRRLYNVDVDYIAFYSPSRNRVFYSADNARLRVVAHEIGHVVAENYFTISPPQRIHEVLAQFAEQHVMD